MEFKRSSGTLKNLLFKRFRFLNELKRNKRFLVGFSMLTFMILASTIGTYLLPYNPFRVGLFPRKRPPSLEYPLGTDTLGRNVLGELLLGIQNSLQIAFIVATIGTLFGAVIGFTAGYRGGTIDAILRVINDSFVLLPMLPMVILISCFTRIVEIWMTALILSIFAWAWPARLVRAQTLSLRERDFIYMARLSGKGSMEIVFTELMPHMAQFLTANFANASLWAVLTETGISILGLGPQYTMTVGMILYWANYYSAVFNGFWWWWSAPLIAIIWLLTSLYLVHTGLDEIINPRLKR